MRPAVSYIRVSSSLQSMKPQAWASGDSHDDAIPPHRWTGNPRRCSAPAIAPLVLIAGGLAQCRIGSKHLALQIKAIEEGLLPRGA